MKFKNQRMLISPLLLTLLVVVFGVSAADVLGQKKCGNTGQTVKFTIQNNTSKPLEIKVVNDDCKEVSGRLLKAGDKAGGSSFVGVMFRAYEFPTGKLISEIKLNAAQSIYKITKPKPTVSLPTIAPKDGFLKETNLIRAKKNLDPMMLDAKLTDACQWFAELMAEVDKGYPVHNASELGMKKLYKERNKASQRLVYYGWGKKNKAHYEVTALDTVQDPNLIGNHFARLWALSKTHYKPFMDKDRTKYNRVGFGFAKAKRGTNRYYACAIFGKIKQFEG
ncbi:MAG: hypothetical protein HKN25_07800 [Pyrinomonadaceae bacterium]|nr:hypothetical protein [Pyrinomonadaceae bacterium]